MFGIDFYPTPIPVIQEMIEPWKDEFSGASFCDPSAGKGDILSYVKHRGSTNNQKYFAIEIDPNLQSILSGKGFNLIGDDFLLYSGQYHFDFIFMNPPFSSGARHLLKAWEVARNTKIACLLNAETIDNPYTEERQLLCKIIEDNGGTIKRLGNCFSTAERKTDVEVVLVRLEKKVEQGWQFSGEKVKHVDFENIEADLGNQVARADYIGALVQTYKTACEAAYQLCLAQKHYNFYANTFSTLQVNKREDDKSYIIGHNYNEMVECINRRAWNTVFEKTKMKKLLTSKLQEDFNKFQEQQGRLEFNEKNIGELFDMLILNRGKILNDCLIHVFDKMTDFHEDNRIHVEGWKTNDAYMVNKKVVLPHYVQYDDRYGRDMFRLDYRKGDFLSDVDKAMCFLTGKRMPEYVWKDYKYVPEEEGYILTIKDALEDRFNKIGWVGKGDKFDNVVESEFFIIKFWKKGTMHIEFKDRQLLDRFNYEVAKGKGWLMGTEGKSYQRKKAA